MSFDEVMLLEPLWMVYLMASDDLLCRLVMDATTFLNNQEKQPSESVCNAEVLSILLCGVIFRNITTFNMHTLLPQ